MVIYFLRSHQKGEQAFCFNLMFFLGDLCVLCGQLLFLGLSVYAFPISKETLIWRGPEFCVFSGKKDDSFLGCPFSSF